MGKVEISLVLITKFLFEGFDVGLLIIKVRKKKKKLLSPFFFKLPHLRLKKLFHESEIAFPLTFYTSPLLKWEDISFPSFHLGHFSTFIFVTDNSIYYPKLKRKKKNKEKFLPFPSLSLLPSITKLMNFNIIPFRYSEETFLSFIPSLLFWYLTNLLGSTNPERNALLQEPLSTSVENYNYSLSFLVVTTIKIYTNGVSNLIHIKSSTNFYVFFSIAPFYLKICILFQFSVWYKLLFILFV